MEAYVSHTETVTLAASLFLRSLQGVGYDIESPSWLGALVSEGPFPSMTSLWPTQISRLPPAGCSLTLGSLIGTAQSLGLLYQAPLSGIGSLKQ